MGMTRKKSDSLLDAGGIPTFASCKECQERYLLTKLRIEGSKTLCPKGHILTRWFEPGQDSEPEEIMVCPNCKKVREGSKCWKCRSDLLPDRLVPR